MKIYITRHGEALDDIEDCYGGIADFPLTDTGRDQAASVADRLQNEGIQAIFSSPLERARETAEIIASKLGTEGDLTVVEDLQERNSYGVLSGVNKDRAKQIFKRVFANLKEKPGYSREPLVGAEDFDEFIQRVHRAFAEVVNSAASQGKERILIVTHGKFSRALFEHVLAIDEEFDLKLSAVNIVEYQPAVAKLGSSSTG